MSRLQARDNGMACLTIDSLLGKFCYYCGTKGNIAVPPTVDQVGPDFAICICLECIEAKRLDDIDEATLKAEVAAMPVFLRTLMEKLRNVPGTYDIDDSDIDQLHVIAQKLEEDAKPKVYMVTGP